MVAAATAPVRRRRGLSIGWLLLGAAVLGSGAGVGLALRNAPDPDALLSESEQLARRSLPLGAPAQLALPDQSHDPWAADAKSLAGVPPYPGASPRKLTAGTQLAQRAEMAVAWFETVDSVDDVVSFYEAAYRDEQRIYASYRFSERLGYVAYLDPPKGSVKEDPDLDPTEGLMHLVTVMQQGRRTVVLVSALEPLRLLDALKDLPDGVAFPPRASPVRLFDLSEGAQSHQTLSSVVKQTSLEEVDAFYARHFQQVGWAIGEHNTELGTRRRGYTATRKGMTQVVMIDSRGRDVQVVISYDKRPVGPEEIR